MAVTTAEKFDDNLVPRPSNVATIATTNSAPQSKSNGPKAAVPPENPSTVPRYEDQPLATTAAPMANSRMRSQPMIQATNSPKVA